MKNIDCSSWVQRNVMDSLRDSVVSERLGYLYLPLGKAANTEVKRFLWSLEVNAGYPVPVPDEYFGVHINPWRDADKARQSPWNHYDRTELPRFSRDAVEKFSFSVVRNPYIKLLSAYLDKIVTIQRIDDSEMQAAETQRYSLPQLPQTFADFVDIIAHQSDKDVDIHWTGQCFRLMYEFLPIKWIGYFEALGDAFTTLSERFNMPIPLPTNRAVHATSASSKYAQYLTDDVCGKIFERYRVDFELLGYAERFDPFNLGPVAAKTPAGAHADLVPGLVDLLGAVRRRDAIGAAERLAALQAVAAQSGRTLSVDSEIAAMVEGVQQ